MDIFSEAYNIFIVLDDDFIKIVSLSLYVSLLATVIASIKSFIVDYKINGEQVFYID